MVSGRDMIFDDTPNMCVYPATQSEKIRPQENRRLGSTSCASVAVSAMGRPELHGSEAA